MRLLFRGCCRSNNAVAEDAYSLISKSKNDDDDGSQSVGYKTSIHSGAAVPAKAKEEEISTTRSSSEDGRNKKESLVKEEEEEQESTKERQNEIIDDETLTTTTTTKIEQQQKQQLQETKIFKHDDTSELPIMLKTVDSDTILKDLRLGEEDSSVKSYRKRKKRKQNKKVEPPENEKSFQTATTTPIEEEEEGLEQQQEEIVKVGNDDTSSILNDSSSNIVVYSTYDEGSAFETSLYSHNTEEWEENNEVHQSSSKLASRYNDKDRYIIIDEEDEDVDEITNNNDSLYPILGLISKNDTTLLKVRLMEALRGFLPFAISEENYWLKYSSSRDGHSLLRLLLSVRASQYTLLLIKAAQDVDDEYDDNDGCIFGSFTSTPWQHQKHKKWYGSGQSFLFKYNTKSHKLEVYPYTGADDLVQYCTVDMMAVGGGDFNISNSITPNNRNNNKNYSSPYNKGQEKNGIGLLIDKDLKNGETYSCATFCNPKLCNSGHSTKSQKNEFKIDTIEIWTLTPCMTEEEAIKLESHHSFVEKHRVE